MLKRISRIALFSMLSFTISTLAADPNGSADSTDARASNAESTVSEAADQLDVISSKTVYKSVKDSEIASVIQGFKAKISKDNASLNLLGLVTKECAEHLRVQLDTPSEEEGSLNYSLKIEKTDFYSSKNPDEVIRKADDDCSVEKTKECEPDTCVSVTQVKGALLALQTEINEDTKIQYCTIDRHLDANDEDKHHCADLPKKHGGALILKSEKTLRAERKALERFQRADLIQSKCKDAEAGNRDALEELDHILGENKTKEQKQLIASIAKSLDEKDFQVLQEKLSSHKSIDEMNDLIDEVVAFAEDHKAMRKEAQMLLMQIADRENPENSLDDSDQAHKAKFLLVERALKAAHNIDPSNRALTTALYETKLKRFQWSAQSGKDSFYNDSTRKEIFQAYNNISRWSSNPDSGMSDLSKKYNDALRSASIPLYHGMTQQGPNVIGYLPGTALDETFVKLTIKQQYDAYMKQFQTQNGAINSLQPNASSPNGQMGSSF